MFTFSTNYGIVTLAMSIQWFGDGTFKLCLPIFSEMCTTYALVNYEVLVLFVFLPSKTDIVYEQLFTTVATL